jgi:hypothetical protein
MNNTVFLTVIALISVGVGVAIGVFISSLRTEKPVDSAQPKSRENLIQTATILQDRKTGNLFLEVNGVTVRDPSDFSASQRQQLTTQIQTLLTWLKPSQVGTAGSQIEAPLPLSTSQTSSEAPVTLPEITPAVTKMGPIDLFARSISPDARPVSRGPQSIAAQIDEILQSKLADSPLAERGIRLMELPTKGLVVMVGLQQYEDVDSVPDAEVRALIRQSVEEWEKTQTQG